MSLSIHTNFASMVSQNSLARNNNMLSNAMERLGTGFRVNSAADDAAGLQIANRLTAQTRGMAVAQRNAQDAISMLQTADGALDEISSIAFRMKDLATQAANGTNSDNDRAALNAEYQELATEVGRIMKQTTFGGNALLQGDPGAESGTYGDEDHVAGSGTMASNITFQIGAGSKEILEFSASGEISELVHAYSGDSEGTVTDGQLSDGDDDRLAGLGAITTHYQNAEGQYLAADGTALAAADQENPGSWVATDFGAVMNGLDNLIEHVGGARAKMGANINRLEHTINNLASISQNVEAAKGRIMDADFAVETSNMTKQQMLMQSGISILGNANQMTGLVASLLR